jgi:membrane protein DedA with SNARE-associated domain
MHAVVSVISTHIAYAPLFVFGALILAGFNLPMSEDLLIITSAFIARADHSLLLPLYIAIYCGVIASDHIAYWIGNRIGRGLTKKKFFASVLTPDKIETLHRQIDRFGIFTFIVCRFIPFGVRNTLFMGSGLMRMKYRLFVIFDSISAAISTATLFFLVYFLGSSIERPFKVVGIVLFILLILITTAIIIKIAVGWRRRHPGKQAAPSEPNPQID